MKKLISLIIIICLLLPADFAVAGSQPVKGVWVCSVANMDFPSEKGLDKKSLQSEINSIITNCKNNNINTIFFQVRPNSDALYKSDIFPWSAVLSGTQGIAPDGNFDPLEYIVSKAHAVDIELHAWINPYRIGDPSELSPQSPAKLHPEYTVTCSDGKMYYNPAIPEVRKLIVDGVREIINKYNVDGIHFDDYFYPYDVDEFPDSDSYKKYGQEFDNIADFRRNNVNLLVKETKDVVHNKNKNLRFGISPFGIWDNKRDNPEGSDTTGMSSYSEIYADSRYWVTENLVDYICPQIYWSFENTAAPFDKVLNWWNDLCKNKKTELYVGIALYKQGTDEAGWQDKDQILRQMSLCETKSSVKGTVLFRYDTLINPPEFQVQEKAPVKSSTVKITGPVNNYKTEAATCSVTGMADPSKSLTVNGKTVSMTKNGYFAVCLDLKQGKNVFEFSNETSKASVTINRISTKPQPAVTKLTPKYPIGDCAFYSGETITFFALAPENSEVYAVIDGIKLRLLPQSDGREYKAAFQLPDSILKTDAPINVSFVSQKDGKTDSTPDTAKISVLTEPMTMYTNKECYTYNDYQGGSMMDNYQYPESAKLQVTASVGDRYRLNTGKWIEKTDVADSKTESTADIDKSKYIETTFSFEKSYTYKCDVTSSGALCIEFYHAAGDNPKIKKQDSVKVTAIKNATRTKVILSMRKSEITGFYADCEKSDSLSLWLYKNDSNGMSDKTIVIDVGHGGEDCGALGPAGSEGETESDLNLALAQLVKQKLESYGAKVYLTRTDDTTLLLKERAKLIRSYSPDLCISIHHNSVSTDSDYNAASGLLTLHSRQISQPLADALSRNLSMGTGIKNQGIMRQSLNVCREYRFPCVLIECGYICNPSEYEKLLTFTYKNALCNNIVLSIVDYFN